MKQNVSTLLPVNHFPKCPALDGYHCQTNSLAKIFSFYDHPLSEDMLLGLGAGMGFIYWHQKGTLPFLGGRSNLKSFFSDIGRRTLVDIKVKTSTSAEKAEKRLIEFMNEQKPVMVYGDMAFLPWFDFPGEYHFGAHTFVICGYDGKNNFLASDMDPQSSGFKKGIYSVIGPEQLKKARNSNFKPFPPHNAWLEFDFSKFRFPDKKNIFDSIKQTASAMLNPPISNAGVKGFIRTANELKRWQSIFDEKYLRLALFNVYIFIEVGGTGGGCFRYMYSRFLKEAYQITSSRALLEASEMIYESGRKFTETAYLFKNIENSGHISLLIKEAIINLKHITSLEEKTFTLLLNSLN